MPAVSKQPKYGYIDCHECGKSVGIHIKRDIKRKKYCSNDCKNKVNRRLNRTCEVCYKEFTVTHSALKTRPCKYCSKACSDIGLKNKRKGEGKMLKCVELAKQGLTIREISEKTGYPRGSVSSYLNKAKFRKIKGKSYCTISKKLKQKVGKCEICGFNRTLDAAHIIPARDGGDLSESNTVILCPNHHRLFDTKKLTLEEAEKISYKIKNYKDYVYLKEVKDAC